PLPGGIHEPRDRPHAGHLVVHRRRDAPPGARAPSRRDRTRAGRKIMTRRDDEILDRAIEDIRTEPVDADALRAAADRVRQRLEAATSTETAAQGCPGYQALFPAYLRGEVPPARELLLEDHVR